MGSGIVRKTDDLGRIVIPKEMRRALNLKEGDPLEFFLENSSIILKKYYVPENREILEKCDKLISDLVDRNTDYLFNKEIEVLEKLREKIK